MIKKRSNVFKHHLTKRALKSWDLPYCSATLGSATLPLLTWPERVLPLAKAWLIFSELGVLVGSR